VASVLPTVISEDEVEQFAQISDGKYLSEYDMSEISRLYDSWPPYELKATVQVA
jgi:hypothetical protein